MESKEAPDTAQPAQPASVASRLPLAETTDIVAPHRIALLLIPVCLAIFLTAFETMAVTTALPTIVHALGDFPASDFVWAGSCYLLAAAAVLPLSGTLSQIFGRKPVILSALVAFAIGSALCGAANGRSLFLFGRTVQGIGSGGIVALTSLIVADLVPLSQRGKATAQLGLAWCLACFIGPIIGGELAQNGAWRWLFYLNIPLCALSGGLIWYFLHLRGPGHTLREKVARIDWVGNFIVIGGTTSTTIALTWGGSVYNWTSFHVLVPLCIGLCALGLFALYEKMVPNEPTMPIYLLSNMTSLSGYLQTFLINCILTCFAYYLPVYYQACKSASPTTSAVDVFGLTIALTVSSVAGSISVVTFQKYRPQLWVSWALLMLGSGLMSTLTSAGVNIWQSIGFAIIVGAAVGTLFTVSVFPIMAPLPVAANAHAVALAMFFRMFGQVWGVTVGGTVLQNQLQHRLSADILPGSISAGDLTYALVAVIEDLPEDVRLEVQTAFAAALATLWRVVIGFAGAGLLSSFLMRNVPMHIHTDEAWALKEKGHN
ncbi:major facilitator superfamily domain-containing protein [Mycena floridula]|nr:major facilitator superfamily domain-containing protein [Mycena floridula]